MVDVFAYPTRSGFLFIKRTLQNWNYYPKGLFFRRGIKRTRQNWTYDLKGLFFRRGQTDGIYAPPMQTSSVYKSLVQLVWVSVLTRTNAVIGISLWWSTFSSSVYATKNVKSTYSEAGFTSNSNYFTPKSNNFTPNSNDLFCHPCLGMIKWLSWRAINPESHLLWEAKA